jgi:hypothetical protein
MDIKYIGMDVHKEAIAIAVYTNKHDVTARLEQLFRAEGIRASILRASVPTQRREAWYREQLRRGIDVAICHPKIVETGLDYVEYELECPVPIGYPPCFFLLKPVCRGGGAHISNGQKYPGMQRHRIWSAPS